MKREAAIKAVMETVHTPKLAIVTAKAVKNQANNYALKLLEATLKDSTDTDDNWFTALAVLYMCFPALAESIIEEAIVLSGKPKKKKKTVVKTVIYVGMPTRIEAV